MNKKFARKLEEYLATECYDYDLEYDYEWNEEMKCCVVTITQKRHPEVCRRLRFKYDEEEDILSIDMGESYYRETKISGPSVKYFWILVAPSLFPYTYYMKA